MNLTTDYLSLSNQTEDFNNQIVFNITSMIFNSTKQNLAIATQQQQQQPAPSVPSYTIAMSLAIYILIFIIGFFGNAIVIFVVCCNKSLQHNTNYCLVNLSVADLLLIIVCMPSAIVDLFAKEVWYFGYILCKVIPWLEYTIAHASVFTIMAISVERSLAITSPLVAKQMFTSKRLFLVVVFIWVTAALAAAPFILSTVYAKVSVVPNQQAKVPGGFDGSICVCLSFSGVS